MAHKILIVDDDQFLLDMYTVKFKEEGYEVDTAAGGKTGLEKLKAGEFNAVLFDMIMPGMDGLGFLKEVHSLHLPKNPVLIALSNQSQETDIEKAKELGVDDYIIKANAIPSEVVSRVASHLH